VTWDTGTEYQPYKKTSWRCSGEWNGGSSSGPDLFIFSSIHFAWAWPKGPSEGSFASSWVSTWCMYVGNPQFKFIHVGISVRWRPLGQFSNKWSTSTLAQSGPRNLGMSRIHAPLYVCTIIQIGVLSFWG